MEIQYTCASLSSTTHRLRRQRRHTKSPTLTFIVNPSCEGLEGEGSGSGEGWDELQTGDTAPIVKNDFNSREQ